MKAILILLHLIILSWGTPIKGKVVAISDGDSFTLLTADKKQLRIRLYGIDAPERGQPFSTASKNYLSGLIFNKSVSVEVKEVDRYGRIVGVVQVGKVNVNEAILRAGYAWHFKRYDNSAKWAKLEHEARSNKRGIWSHSNPVPPWNWRKRINKVSTISSV